MCEWGGVGLEVETSPLPSNTVARRELSQGGSVRMKAWQKRNAASAPQTRCLGGEESVKHDWRIVRITTRPFTHMSSRGLEKFGGNWEMVRGRAVVVSRWWADVARLRWVWRKRRCPRPSTPPLAVLTVYLRPGSEANRSVHRSPSVLEHPSGSLASGSLLLPCLMMNVFMS